MGRACCFLDHFTQRTVKWVNVDDPEDGRWWERSQPAWHTGARGAQSAPSQPRTSSSTGRHDASTGEIQSHDTFSHEDFLDLEAEAKELEALAAEDAELDEELEAMEA